MGRRSLSFYESVVTLSGEWSAADLGAAAASVTAPRWNTLYELRLVACALGEDVTGHDLARVLAACPTLRALTLSLVWHPAPGFWEDFFKEADLRAFCILHLRECVLAAGGAALCSALRRARALESLALDAVDFGDPGGLQRALRALAETAATPPGVHLEAIALTDYPNGGFDEGAAAALMDLARAALSLRDLRTLHPLYCRRPYACEEAIRAELAAVYRDPFVRTLVRERALVAAGRGVASSDAWLLGGGAPMWMFVAVLRCVLSHARANV